MKTNAPDASTFDPRIGTLCRRGKTVLYITENGKHREFHTVGAALEALRFIDRDATFPIGQSRHNNTTTVEVVGRWNGNVVLKVTARRSKAGADWNQVLPTEEDLVVYTPGEVGCEFPEF